MSKEVTIAVPKKQLEEMIQSLREARSPKVNFIFSNPKATEEEALRLRSLHINSVITDLSEILGEEGG